MYGRVLALLLTCACACSRVEPQRDAGAAPAASLDPGLAPAPVPEAGPIRVSDPPGPGDAATGPPPSLAGKTVLQVGDSMVGGDLGLTKALEARFRAEGAKLVRDYKVSESIVSYDRSPRLKQLLAKHDPDVVIITLGANDVFVPYPASMAANVRSIAARVGSRECYWIGPPTWKPDTGIVKILADNVAPCAFFDSSGLDLERASDGIHPTDRGGAEWAARFWAFYRPGEAVPLLDGGADGAAPVSGRRR
ncbi:MAG: hypothetical protein JWP97_4495 [Labilithrix sp.]|nr:hypothetical protein [Labilithrix sp.]